MAVISIDIMEDEIEETIDALRWWGGERMEKLATRILKSAVEKVDKEE